MTMQQLATTIRALTQGAKGILAVDESPATIAARFASYSSTVACTPDTRRDYREMLFTTKGLHEYIAGIIAHEETLEQHTQDGRPFVQVLNQYGIVVGAKVDAGLVKFADDHRYAGEHFTKGLDHLDTKLASLIERFGIKFTKWRALYEINDINHSPSMAMIRANADGLALYALLCQSYGLVPIIEPELSMAGKHTLEQAAAVTAMILQELFSSLRAYGVALEYIILKTSMVVSGKDCSVNASVAQVAAATLAVLQRTVPDTVPSINFLSGGQSSKLATMHLNAMNNTSQHLPWRLSYSFARALHDDSMRLWLMHLANPEQVSREACQDSLRHRAALNSQAVLGNYDSSME